MEVAGKAVEVYTAPEAAEGCYLTLRTLRAGEMLSSPALPGLVVTLAELFS